MKKVAAVLAIIIITVFISGCTAPPEENVHIYSVTITSTITKTVTKPYFTTATVTRTETTVTTNDFITTLTTTKTISSMITHVSTVIISSSGNVTVTKTFTVYVNALGDGQPNEVVIFTYYPTTKITYTVSGSITLTYTPYIELRPGLTTYSRDQSIIIVPSGNTMTVYWPALSGTNPILIKFLRGVFRWWDYLYIQDMKSNFPEETDPFALYAAMASSYTYATERAQSFSEFYLPHEFLSTKSGNDGDFAEFYGALMYAREKIGTIVVINYSPSRVNFAFVYSGRIIDANLRYFYNIQALANAYGIDPTATYIEICTFRPIRTVYTVKITHQPIMFLNYIPQTVDITAVETATISGSTTRVIQYAGSVSGGRFDFIKIVNLRSKMITISLVGDTNAITRWYWGVSTVYTVRTITYVFAGGKITLLPAPMETIFGVAFDNALVTDARISNHTTVIRGINIDNDTITTFERTKVMSTEYYTYRVIDAKFYSTITAATGTIFYS